MGKIYIEIFTFLSFYPKLPLGSCYILCICFYNKNLSLFKNILLNNILSHLEILENIYLTNL